MENLKPCPFCGSYPRTYDDKPGHCSHYNKVCPLGGKDFRVEEWNCRTEAQEKRERPKVICLCGSTRFVREMAIISWEFEKLGHICLGLHLLPDAYWQDKPPVADHLAEHENCKEHMDELHKRKIDIADEIFVININGYIGESTRSEINYAIEHGKQVKYLEPPTEGE